MTARPDDREWLWSKAEAEPNTGCWLWPGEGPHGYGRLRRRTLGPGQHYAHRAAWIIHYGPIPSGLWVLHRCDNPPCVNPGHLFLGTADDNNKDRDRKGRTVIVRGDQHGSRIKRHLRPRGDRNGARTRPDRVARGVRNGMAKLTDDHVRVIRHLLERTTLPLFHVAQLMGVGRTITQDIQAGRKWRHVFGDALTWTSHPPRGDKS